MWSCSSLPWGIECCEATSQEPSSAHTGAEAWRWGRRAQVSVGEKTTAQRSTAPSAQDPDTESARAMTLDPWVLAITGASGAPYAVRLLGVLARARVPIHLIVSSHGWRLLETEAGIASIGALEDGAGGGWTNVTVFDNSDRGATPASGSAKSSGMVICPCSMGTVSAIAHGSSRSLVERAADVTLKERRPLIVVPRETPFSLVHLRNLTALAEAGATVVPAAPGFYHRPKKVEDLVDFVVQRVIDHMRVDVELIPRWQP